MFFLFHANPLPVMGGIFLIFVVAVFSVSYLADRFVKKRRNQNGYRDGEGGSND